MTKRNSTLAERLGLTIHESVLRRKLLSLQARFPSATAACIEDWLIDVANARGANVVVRPDAELDRFAAPGTDTLANEELVGGICQLQCLDRPQMLRLAAQLISRGVVQVGALALIARRERIGGVLAALAAAALRVDPQHPVWRSLREQLAHERPLRDVLLHWTRLAEPVMPRGAPNRGVWRLAA